MKKKFLLVLIILVCLCLFGCKDSKETNFTIETISEFTGEIGEEIDLNIVVNSSDTSLSNEVNSNLNIIADKEGVVSIEDGYIQAIGVGEVIITVSYKDVSAQTKVTILEKIDYTITDVDINKPEIEMEVGDEFEFQIKYKCAVACEEVISSNNEEVISVDGNKIKALKVGTATIIVGVKNASKSTRNAYIITVKGKTANITYVLDGGSFEETAPNKYEIGKITELVDPVKSKCEFAGWTIEKVGGTFINKIDENMDGDIVLYANWIKESDEYYYITYDFNGGRLITKTPSSVDEMIEGFWNEFYTWSNSDLTLDKFKENVKAKWSSGSAGSYKLYKPSCPDEVDDSYFINSKGNEDWKKFFDTFDKVVNDINSAQGAWNNDYVGYIRFNEVFQKSSKSYWNSTRLETLRKAAIIKVNIVDKVKIGASTKLVDITTDDGRTFLGWVDENGNKITNGNQLTKSTKLTATWSASTPMESFVLLNKIEKMERFSTHQLKWSITPSNTTNKNVKFISSDSSILSIDENGLMTANKNGTVKVTLNVLDNSKFNVSFDCTVYTNPYIDLSTSNTIVKPGETTTIVATVKESDKNVIWESSDESIATVTQEGVVKGIKVGSASIVAKLKDGQTVTAEMIVNVVSDGEDKIFDIINKAHNNEINVVRELRVGGSPNYYTDVYVSASDLLFNWDYKVDRSYEEIQKNHNNHGGTKTSTEFICVHYTAGTTKGSTAKATASYFANGGSDSSIHYTTGNDGIYHILDDSLVGWHAGDGTGTKFQWIKTGVKASANVKPVWGAVKNAASSTGYYFTLNGKATTISVPITGSTSSGTKKTITNPEKHFSYFGPAWRVVNGEYEMGTTWVCFTQDASGIISSRGGNNNSVGIETACNMGSDLWLTYHYTAQLVARLMDTYKLDNTRVLGHNAFSGKNCPQTLLENNGELWEKFMEMVDAEYEMYTNITKDNKYTITCKSNNPDILADNGRIKLIPNYSTTVSYTVTVKNNTTQATTSRTYTTIVHGSYIK